MAENNEQLASAVRQALEWMDSTTETAAAALGMNPRTLDAMCEGIVPMRSLIIRFAGGIARQAEGRPGAPEWWKDIDAWLQIAGYPPRRDGNADGAAGERESANARPARAARPVDTWHEPPPDRGRRPAPPPAAEDPSPAHEHYRATYERQPFGNTFVHVFALVDQNERTVFKMNLSAHIDYKKKAAEVKQDLQTLTKSQFERKYGRFRVGNP